MWPTSCFRSRPGGFTHLKPNQTSARQKPSSGTPISPDESLRRPVEGCPPLIPSQIPLRREVLSHAFSPGIAAQTSQNTTRNPPKCDTFSPQTGQNATAIQHLISTHQHLMVVVMGSTIRLVIFGSRPADVTPPNQFPFPSPCHRSGIESRPGRFHCRSHTAFAGPGSAPHTAVSVPDQVAADNLRLPHPPRNLPIRK
jgi:hypothetical protein